tara:strand:- start:851 stop:1090 length:240 start_codon:yes stop_codon:yes gene_type:complete
MKQKKGITFGRILWYLFFGVGYIALYLKYYFPSEWGKTRNTAITARQLKAKHIWGPFNALVIYLSIFLLVVASIGGLLD